MNRRKPTLTFCVFILLKNLQGSEIELKYKHNLCKQISEIKCIENKQEFEI
jgi:hypothetical protein